MNKKTLSFDSTNLKWYGLIVLILLTAYIPIASFQLAIKNDFFQAYFPVKFFLSESIKAGEWPLWNPFLNYGFPAYGDMSASYWNPLTWLFALIGYNAYLFTLEQLIYMLLAGIGMFKLMGIWSNDQRVKLIVAASYLCSGFITSHQQHFNWITATGLLPFCVYYFITVIKYPKTVNFFKLLLVFILFLTSVHPGMIIGLFLLLLFTTFYWRRSIFKIKFNIKHILVALIFFVLIISGMVYGYAEVLFYTNRSQPIIEEAGSAGSTNISNWISFLWPLVSNDRTGIFSNEFTLRNCYIGLVMFSLLIYSLISKNKDRTQVFFYITGLFFLILSSNIINSFYTHIPLINFVRLNAEFRIFALFTLIIGGGIQLKDIFQSCNQKFIRILKTISLLTLVILLITFFSDKNLYKFTNKITFSLYSTNEIKIFIDQFNWRQALIIQSIIQCILLLLLITTYKKSRMNFFTAVIILDLIINATIQLPFTAVGRNKLHDIHMLIEASPKFPQTPLYQSEWEVIKNYPKTEKLIGGWGFYSKQVALNDNLYYPLMLSTNLEYFKNGTHSMLMNKPFIFSLNSTLKYNYIKTGYTFWSLYTDNAVKDTLLIKQNYFKGWNAWVDGQPVPTIKSETSLIGIVLAAGKHEVKLEYKRDIIKYLLILEWVAILIIVIYLIRFYLIKYILP